MIRIIIILLIILVVLFIFFTLAKIVHNAFTKNDFYLEKKGNQKNPWRRKYTLSAHQDEIAKMEHKIENFQNSIDKRK